MFKENDIVRVITEDGTGEVMRVLESYDEGINAGTSHAAVGNDDH